MKNLICAPARSSREKEQRDVRLLPGALRRHHIHSPYQAQYSSAVTRSQSGAGGGRFTTSSTWSFRASSSRAWRCWASPSRPTRGRNSHSVSKLALHRITENEDKLYMAITNCPYFKIAQTSLNKVFRQTFLRRNYVGNLLICAVQCSKCQFSHVIKFACRFHYIVTLFMYNSDHSVIWTDYL